MLGPAPTAPGDITPLIDAIASAPRAILSGLRKYCTESSQYTLTAPRRAGNFRG